MNKQEQADLSLARSRLEQRYDELSTDSRKNTSRSHVDSIDNATEEREEASKPTRKSILTVEKKTSKQEKIAEGASQSTSDKSSSDKVKVRKTDSQAEGILQDAPSQKEMLLKAIAIEIFVRTLRINTDLLNGTHKNNDYDDFLQLLTVDDNEAIIKHLLSSKETTSGVAIHRIPHFFLHEYVFHNNKGIADIFKNLMILNSQKNKKLKRHVEKQLRKFAGLVRLDDTYQGIPLYFYVKYFKKNDVFATELPKRCLELMSLSDTGISAIDYLAFETALRQANAPFIPDIDEDDYSEASNSVEGYHSDDSEEIVDVRNIPKKSVGTDDKDKADSQENLPDDMVKTIFSLCRISDLQQILETYIDMWYDEEFKKQLKSSTDTFSKNRDAIVSKVAKFEESRNKRLDECQSFLADMSNTNELATALNLLEHRLQKMHFIRKSRLRDILLSKIQAIRKEEFFQQHQGSLVILNTKFPNLPYLAEIKRDLEHRNRDYLQENEDLWRENGKLKDQREKLLAKNERLKDDKRSKQERIKTLQDDNQKKQETNESLQDDNRRQQQTIERLQDDKHRQQQTIESLKSEKQALLETIQRLQRRTGNGPTFFERRRNGRDGEVIEVQSDSEKEETSSESDGQYVFYDTTQTDIITLSDNGGYNK